MVPVSRSQIFWGCTRLEELTLDGCTHALTTESTRYSCPFLGATAARLHNRGSSKYVGVHLPWRRPRPVYRGLRHLQLRWSTAQQHAHITRYMLKDLAVVPSVSIYADSVMLRVPSELDQLPAALKIIARSMQLIRSGTVDGLRSELASFRSRCQLVIEGVCLDEVVANWSPFTEHDYVEDYRAWTYWVRPRDEPVDAASESHDDDANDPENNLE